MNLRRSLSLLALVLLLPGCAGGWRGGVVPAQWAEGGSAAASGSAATSTAPSSTTSADGTVFVWKGEGGSVALAGEFNAWSTSADPLAKQTDGSWKLVKKLEPGRYAYKFVIDGTNWKPDPKATDKVDDGFGGTNSVVVVGGAAAVAVIPSPAPAKSAAAGTGAATTADGTVFVWKGEGGTVALAGEFNAWSTSADPLSKQADGSWKLVKKLEPGRYAYKFVIDGTNWKPDPNAADKVDDGFGGTNSVVVVGGAAAAPAASTPAQSAAAGTSAATTADGTAFVWKGEGGTVALAGEFNAWSTSADPLSKQADGSWKLVKKLEPGRYAYKFVIDGTNWKPDPNAADKVDDGFGGTNSVVVVGGSAASPATPTAPSAGSASVPVTGRARAPEQSAEGVLFTHAAAARSVSLCGDFNGWAPLADPMKQQADGTWTLRKKLAAGRHTYKFLVDGTKWLTDPANPESEDDGFGGKNSVLTVK